MRTLLIGPFGAHYAKIVDADGKYVKWATNRDIELYLFKSLVVANRKNRSIELNVSYTERELAKSYGAKWDPTKKVWYTLIDNPKAMDMLDAHPSWFTAAAVEAYEYNRDLPNVTSTPELDAYISYRYSTNHAERLEEYINFLYLEHGSYIT